MRRACIWMCARRARSCGGTATGSRASKNLFAAGEYFEGRKGETADQANERRNGGLLTLAEARVKREEWRALVKQGIHPAHNRELARSMQATNNANTFEAVALEWIEKNKPRWTAYYLRQVQRFLKVDVFPYIGTLPIRAVTAAHLLEIMHRVEGRGASTVALLVRQWSSAIFRYAVATLRADSDPAVALRGAVQRPTVEHATPLTREDLIKFVKSVDAYGGYRTTVIALRLMLLTFVRTKELRLAEWSEVHLERAEWRIPAARMKMRDLHIVPLSHEAVELLRELHSHTGGRGFLFPNYRNPKISMSATTLNRALERMGFNGKDTIGFSAHGFRATASTMLNELGFRSDVIERQLAHSERNKTRASYNQAEYLEERRAMMQQWADLTAELAKIQSSVVPLRRTAG